MTVRLAEKIDPEFARAVQWWITSTTGPSGRPDRRLAWEQEPGWKAGRNDPCPCGSEKKYKKCCLT